MNTALQSLAAGSRFSSKSATRRKFVKIQTELHETLSDAVKGLLDRDRDPSNDRSLQLTEQKMWEKPWEMNPPEEEVDESEDGADSADSIVA